MSDRNSCSAGETQERHLLLMLSDCCSKHGSTHTNKIPQEEIPERCQRDIEALRKILPKVEGMVAVEQKPHPLDLAQLCHFYQTVMSGGFCPHAPLLFELGKSGTAVLPRVFSLYQHLASKAILNNTMSVLTKEESDPVADTICSTIAHMLAFIRDSRLQESLVRDLILLTFDLAVIAQVMTPESNFQVTIFGETVAKTQSTEEYVLKVSSVDSLYVIWSGTLVILDSLFKLQKDNRLDSSYELAETNEIMDLASAHADLSWSFVLDDGDLLSTVMTTMRKALSSLPAEARPALVMRNMVAAAKLLNSLLLDWDSLSYPVLSIVTEASLLVSRAIQAHFKEVQHRQMEGKLHSKEALEYSSLCCKLLCNSVIFPPKKMGGVAAVYAIRAAALHHLLNCLPYIDAAAQENIFVKDDVILAHIVLRAIHTSLYTVNDKGSYSLITMAVNQCATTGLFPSLFRLLNSAHLSDVALRIISAMMFANTEKSIDVVSVCQMVWTMNGKDNKKESNDEAVSAAAQFSLPTIGSKRRRGSSQPSPALRVDHSPKRQRANSGRGTNGQLTMSTPSPSSGVLSGNVISPVRDAEALQRGNTSCQESLGSMLHESVLNANRTVAMVDPCLALFATTKTASLDSGDASKEGVSKAIMSIACGCRIIFNWIRNTASIQTADGEANGLFQVASLLMKALKALTLSLSSHWKKIDGHSVNVPVEARQSTSYIMTVGLDAQFALDRLLSVYPKTHGDILTDCLDSIADCARDIWSVHHAVMSSTSGRHESGSSVKGTSETPSNCQEETNRSCRRVCRELRKTLSSGQSNSHDVTPCLCGLLSLPDTLNHSILSSSKDVEVFQFDCTMMLFGKQSNCGICALLSCLRPLKVTEDIVSEMTTHPVGHLFSSVASGSQVTPTMMTLSPLFLLSAAVHMTDKGVSSGAGTEQVSVVEDDGNAQNTPQTIGVDLVLHVSSCLEKLQYGKYLAALSRRSDTVSAATYLSMNRLHELSELTLRAGRDYPETSSAEYDSIVRGILLWPQTALAFILGRILEPGVLTAVTDDQRRHRDPRFDSLQETFRSSRIALLSASAVTDDESLSTEVRIAKWKCIAGICLRSSVNEMSRTRGSYSETSFTKCHDGHDLEISEAIEEPPTLKKIATSLIWLLRSVFADDSSSFRGTASREIGRVLLENKSSLLYALFSTPSNWRRQDDGGGIDRCAEESLHQCAALELVVAPLFQEIDRLLCRYCQVPQSQLSFTMGNSVMNDASAPGISSVATRKGSSKMALSYQRSAVTALSSLCQFADIESPCGLLVFEHSMSRLVRFWTALDSEQSQLALDEATDSVSTSAMAFGEMIRLNRIRNLRSILAQKSFERFMPRLFSDILLPGTGMILSSGGAEVPGIMERESRERQFRFLLTFIGSFLLPSKECSICSSQTSTVHGSYCLHCVIEFVATVLPSVITASVIVEDHDLLLLVTGFKLFLSGERRKISKTSKKPASVGTGRLLGSSPRSTTSTSKMPGVESSRKELVEHTKLLCLSPEIIELILPRILMMPDRSQLIFFLDVVLQRKMPLQQMLASKDGVFLKGIVWEYGRIGDVVSAERALRTAAEARERASQTRLSDESPTGSRRQKEDNTAACLWITARFMYLLVNVVQHRWRSRSVPERTRALRCLRWMIKFLSPSEAPQYLPQIMATINVVMSGDPGSSDESQPGTWQLRLLAIQALSDFVRTAIQCQYETVGSSLATIAVSLFPVLEPDTNSSICDIELRAYEEAGKVAVCLLEWLTQGSVGKNLAAYFRDIPFLPPTMALDRVRDALKTHGVNFDNLIVFSSTENTQHDFSARGSVTSEGGTSNGDSRKEALPTYSLSAQAALRRRLNVLRRLFSHENVSVRRVVLRHLIDLLRANRGLLQRLVESEEGTSLDHFITVSYSNVVQPEAGSDAINGSVTTMVDCLLQRCFTEVDSEAILLLATCWGELGAIDVHRLGEMRMSGSLRAEQTNDDGRSWRLLQAPWQSRPTRYELKVVTKHLVVALKAAPTSSDQHRIAFTIQQILELLDESVKMSNRSDADASAKLEKSSRNQMSDWLREKLSKAGVLETVEPYWFSMFNEVESFVPTEPPFFRSATCYFGWLSKWSRYMLKRSNDDGRNQWCSFFYACRTAVRSQAGMSLAEFILPLLVLDRMCYGNSKDERAVVQELLDVLDFGSGALPGSWTSKMSHTERQKSVNAVFMILDTLQYWSERETEERYHHSRSTSATRSTRKVLEGEDDEVENTCWLWDESNSAIAGLLKAVPLSLQAHAAAAVGMHARALRLIEMSARAEVVQTVYDSEELDLTDSKSGSKDIVECQKETGTQLIKGVDIDLLKEVLGHLNDCETMEGVATTSDTSSCAIDGIRVKEAKGDWAGASYDYERALQLNESVVSRLDLQRGSLRCLLELGQFESVLYQVNGIVHEHRQLIAHEAASDPRYKASKRDIHALPFAVEAAWRLGRWSSLTQILDDVNQEPQHERCLDPDGLYRVSLGKAMHGLHNRSESVVSASIRTARQALMSDLSNVARDSYSRSYSYLIRLHCLREVENACAHMCNQEAQNDPVYLEAIASSYSHEGWNWDGRLNVVSVAGCSAIIDVRLALARLAGDSKLEGSLFLTVGKKARKNGQVHVAANFLAQAEACCIRSRPAFDASSTSSAYVNELLSSIRLQFAKLKHLDGESSAALRILGLENVAGLVETDEKSLQSFAITHERNAIPAFVSDGRDQAADVNRFSRRLLQSTQWMVEGGIKSGSEVMDRFRMVQRLSPTWEKGYFQYAKYIDSVLESRIAALSDRTGETGHLSTDEDTMRATFILRDVSCQRFLLLAMEQYVNALKFNSKHVYQALPRLLSLWFDFTSFQSEEQDVTPSRNQRKNDSGVLSAHYQVEANELMSKNLRAIPAHCFYTAMPQLVSRIGHGNKDTALVVRAILTRILTKHPGQAMWGLAWLLNSASPERVHIGEDIFKGAQSSLLKRKENKSLTLLSSSKSLFRFLIDLAKYEPKDNARSVNIKPWRGDTALIDFIPPVQAALAVSPSSVDNGNTTDAFPIMVPRMRTLCSKVIVMSSKAKPKRIKAFVVPEEQLQAYGAVSPSNNNKDAQPGDMGELHFLVKQEARGDLRKDARVQDLNNVINRLLAASGGPRQRRRLHLRTFAVTCLSEDCGILEWVPNTESLRSLVIQSYNPQASPFSVRRRGKSLGNYGGNMALKSGFEKCQSVYFKNGNLKCAAAMLQDIILKPNPPLLYWYFVQKFMDPHSWYEARTRFTLSCAAWSAVGHVIGLGDRHSENILVDTSSGQCVHVDFDCIFDKGLNLPKPEVVPFRLTANMLDAFGPIGADGIYTGSLKAAMTTLRDNRDTLLSVLEPFIKDPIIDWKRQRSQQKHGKSSTDLEAKRSIKVIDQRLKGVYNLRNPNLKKVKRTDGWSMDQDDEMMQMLPLSVEGQVHKMITEATSSENLVQLYVGWMPWV